MRYNTILTPPRLQFSEGEWDLNGNAFKNTIWSIAKNRPAPIDQTNIAFGTELQVREMVSHCALKVSVAGRRPKPMRSGRTIKATLPPSLQKVLEFSDRRGRNWAAIEEYFRPVAAVVYRDFNSDNDGAREPFKRFMNVFWDTYTVVMAHNRGAEAFVAPNETIRNLEWLSKNFRISGEGQARLARVKALFSLFEEQKDIPIFACAKSDGATFSERVDEMLEDAYLLEASALRRFFSVGANLASLRRDSRRLMQMISKSSKWATGLLKLGSEVATFPSSVTAVSDMISEVSPDSSPSSTAIRLFTPTYYRDSRPPHVVLDVRRIPYSKPVSFGMLLDGPPESLHNETRTETEDVGPELIISDDDQVTVSKFVR